MSGCSAKLGASIAWDEDGNAFGWGCDTSGQLGLGIKDDDDKVRLLLIFCLLMLIIICWNEKGSSE